jgi:hypothetical protein
MTQSDGTSEAVMLDIWLDSWRARRDRFHRSATAPGDRRRWESRLLDDLKRHRTTHPKRPPLRATPLDSCSSENPQGRSNAAAGSVPRLAASGQTKRATRHLSAEGMEISREAPDGAKVRCIGPIVTSSPVVPDPGRLLRCRRAVAGEDVKAKSGHPRRLTPPDDVKG